MLRANANACTGCSNNPNESPEIVEDQKRVANYGPLLAAAFRLHTLAECGLLDRAILTSAEVDMIAIAHDRIVTARMKVQAAFIAEYVGKLLG